MWRVVSGRASGVKTLCQITHPELGSAKGRKKKKQSSVFCSDNETHFFCLQVERPSFSIESLRRHTADSKMDGLTTKGNVPQLHSSQISNAASLCSSREEGLKRRFLVPTSTRPCIFLQLSRLQWQHEFSITHSCSAASDCMWNPSTVPQSSS